MHRLLVVAACAAFALLLALFPPRDAAAEPVYSERELIDGFMRTVFGSENWRVSRQARNRVSKFTGPVRVHIVDTARSRQSRSVSRFVADVSRDVGNLSISTTRNSDRANYLVFLVRRSDYTKVIREALPNINTSFLESAACSGIAYLSPKGDITQAMAFVVVDEGSYMFRHCMVEEFLQGLGPSNDSPQLAYSIFNDRNGISEFTKFDRYILNMLYDPRIAPGMSRRQARQVLPEIVRDLRRRLG